MKTNLTKKLLSLLTAVTMTGTTAVFNIASAAEEATKWSFTEDFQSFDAGVDPSDVYVDFGGRKVTELSDGTKGILMSGSYITIYAKPETSWEYEMTITNTTEANSYSWVSVGNGWSSDYTNAVSDLYGGRVGCQFAEGDGKTKTITASGVVGDIVNPYDWVKFAIGASDNAYYITEFKVRIDDKDLKLDEPSYEINFNDYNADDELWNMPWIQKCSDMIVKVDENGGKYAVSKTSNGSTLLIDTPKTAMVIEVDVDAGGTFFYNTMSGETPVQKNGHFMLQSPTEGKTYRYRISKEDMQKRYDACKGDETGALTGLGLTFYQSVKLRGLRIWYDDEINTIKSWGYNESFDSYSVDDIPSNLYVTYDSKIIDSDGDKCVYVNGKTIKFPAPKKYWRVEIEYKQGKTPTWITFGDATDSTKFMERKFSDNIIQKYQGTVAADSTSTEFVITNGQTYTTITSLKVDIDGRKLQFKPAFTLDLSKYDVGETVPGTEWFSFASGATVTTDANGNKCLKNPTLKFTAPTTGIVVESQFGSSVAYIQTQVYNKSDWLGNVDNYIGLGAGTTYYKLSNSRATMDAKANASSAADKSVAYYHQIINADVTGLTIYYDDVEQQADNWDNYSPYTTMTDFECYNEGAQPLQTGDVYITKQASDGQICVENGNKFMRTAVINFKKLPEHNVVISANVRHRPDSNNAEQLQWWGFYPNSYEALVKQQYDAYIEEGDTAWHSFVWKINAIDNTMEVYKDGAVISSGVLNSITKTDNDGNVLYNKFSQMQRMTFALLELDVDDLKVGIDVEKSYCGGYFADENGDKLTTITANQDIVGKIFAVSSLRNDNNSCMIMALYEKGEDETPKLIKCQEYSINGNRNGTYINSGVFNTGDLEEGKSYFVKQFIWDNTDDMNPLSLPATLQ